MLVYKNHSPHLYMGGVLLTMMVGIIASNRQLQENAKQQTAHAALVRVIDETEPLCRAVLPHQNRLHFLAVPASGYSGNATPTNLWAVDCLDNKNVLLVHLLWSAGSKRALVFSPAHTAAAWKARTATSVPLSETKAVAIAREWACRLSPLSQADVQRPAARTQRSESIVRVRLHLSDGEAIVWLNEWTGELLSGLVQETAELRGRKLPERL